MRRAGLLENAMERHPIFVSFDFAAAFPSLGRTWLFKTLRRFGLPTGCMHLFEAMCYAPTSSVKVDGARRPAFAIEPGAARGCPASGRAWAIAMGPLIRR
eukprot:1349896-Pyramimonas_sp.AAC.1